MSRRRRTPPPWAWMIPVLLLACWLGARSLDTRPLWSDEIHSIYDSRGISTSRTMSLPEVWDEIGTGNPFHAPGYFLLLNGWGRVFSWKPVLLRAMSLLIGLLAIAMTYRLAGDVFASRRAGVFAAAVLATSAFFVHFLFEMRVYTTVALLSTVTVWAYLRIVGRRSAPRWWLWPVLFVGAAGLFYSHYLATVPLLAVGLIHLIFAPKNRRWLAVTGVLIAAALTFLPWVPYLIAGLDKIAENDDLHSRALSLPETVWTFGYMFGNGFIVLFLALSAAAAAASRSRALDLRRLIGIALAGLVIILAVNQAVMVMPEGRLRYLIPLWPLFAALVGIGIAALGRRPRLMFGALALWLVVGLGTTLFVDFTSMLDGSATMFPMQRVVPIIEPRVQSGDILVNYLSDSEENDTHYGQTTPFYFRRLDIAYRVLIGDETRARPKDEAALLEMLHEHPRIWIAYLHDPVPKSLPVLQDALSADYRRCAPITGDPRVVVELFVGQGGDCPPDLLDG